MPDRPRSKAKLAWLVGSLVALQVLVLAAGVGGVYLVDIGRAYLQGEGHYAKAHAEASAALTRYLDTGEPAAYAAFERAIATPRTYALAKLVLDRPAFAPERAVRFLVEAGLDPRDAPGAVWMYRWLAHTPLLRAAKDAWTEADRVVVRLDNTGLLAHALMSGRGRLTGQQRRDLTDRVRALQAAQNRHTRRFARAVSASARTVERAVIAGMVLLTAGLAGGGLLLGRRTARRLAAGERELLAEQGRLRDVVETAADWFWELDAGLRFVSVSPRFTEVTGLDPEAVRGRRLADVLAADAPDDRPAIDDALARRAPFRNLVATLAGRDGQPVTLRLSGRPHRGADGGFAGYRGSASDVTAEVTAQRTAERRRAILEATFDGMADAVVAFDARWRLLAANGRYRAMLDLPEDEMRTGTPLAQLIRHRAERGDYGPGEVDALVRARVEAITAGPRETVLHDHHAGRTAALRIVAMAGGGAVITYSDVTERERRARELAAAKERAELASRAKSDFLANMSHELRTPLNAVIGFSEVMAAGVFGPLDPRYREYAQDIHHSGTHLLQLINDMLDLSRVETGQLELAEEEVRVDELVAAATRMVEARARERGVPIETAVPQDLPSLHADPRRVTQMLVNLLVNAVKFSDPGRPVTVTAERRSDGLAIAVADRGVGIAPEDRDRVFQPFHQAAQTPRALARNEDGVGLGLALVRTLAELHGGAVELDSELGRGTRVTLLLPAWRAVDARTARGRASAGERGCTA